MYFPILSILIFYPIVAAICILIAAHLKWISEATTRIVGGVVSMSIVALSLALYLDFVDIGGENAMVIASSLANIKYQEYNEIITRYGISYSLGLDALSLYFVLLTTFLTSITILVTSQFIKNAIALYISLFLMLEGIILGFFLSSDLLLFYFFFEFSLIPVFLIIGIWGAENKIYAAFKFFLYTFVTSLLMLIAIIYLINEYKTADIMKLTALLKTNTGNAKQMLWLWWAFFLAFAVKTPIWPLHTWLPQAHVQAPTGGSVILAGVLLKMGGYGFLRILIPFFPTLSLITFNKLGVVFGIVSIIYASIIALAQKDIKKLIAYSSIAHMGYVTAGIFSGNEYGLNGAIIQMFSHGLISGALFIIVGFIYEQGGTKEISSYTGIASVVPRLAIFFMIFILASIGLPSTSGFIGEFNVLIGVFIYNFRYGVLLSLGMILGAAYMLWLAKHVIFGKPSYKVKQMNDIAKVDYAALFLISFFILLLGICPSRIIDILQPKIKELIVLTNVIQNNY